MSQSTSSSFPFSNHIRKMKMFLSMHSQAPFGSVQNGNTCENICCNIETYMKSLLMAQDINTTMKNYTNSDNNRTENRKRCFIYSILYAFYFVVALFFLYLYLSSLKWLLYSKESLRYFVGFFRVIDNRYTGHMWMWTQFSMVLFQLAFSNVRQC